MLSSCAVLLTMIGSAIAAESGTVSRMSRTTIHQEVIVRVPVRRRVGGFSRWEERPGPRCLRAEGLESAVLSGPRTIDFLVHPRQRFRARLESGCPTLDFYGGFYLQPTREKICAGRDMIRSRIGGSCLIEEFQRLRPAGQR